MGQARALRLRYTPEALAELERALDDIAEVAPQGARRVRARIQATIDLLLRLPGCGRVTNLQPMRRAVVRPYPYLLFYLATDDELVVVGVRHAGRDPKTMPDAP